MRAAHVQSRKSVPRNPTASVPTSIPMTEITNLLTSIFSGWLPKVILLRIVYQGCSCLLCLQPQWQMRGCCRRRARGSEEVHLMYFRIMAMLVGINLCHCLLDAGFPVSIS